MVPNAVPVVVEVPSPNFDNGRQGYGVEAIVLHIMQGTLQGTDAWFQNPLSQVSAHYGVGLNGEIHKYVQTDDTAWHAGEVVDPVANLVTTVHPGVNPNLYTVGIEHEGYSGDPPAEAQYTASLWLCEQVLQEFDTINVDRDHILLHHEIDANHSGCPGSAFPIDRLMADLIAWSSGARL